MSPEARRWLYSTSVRVRRVAFHAADAASAALLHDPLMLVRWPAILCQSLWFAVATSLRRGMLQSRK